MMSDYLITHCSSNSSKCYLFFFIRRILLFNPFSFEKHWRGVIILKHDDFFGGEIQIAFNLAESRKDKINLCLLLLRTPRSQNFLLYITRECCFFR